MSDHCRTQGGCIVKVLHVDVHVLPGMPGKGGGGVAHAAHLTVASTKHDMPVEHDEASNH